MKIGPCLLTIGLLAAWPTQPSFGKPLHAQRAGAKGESVKASSREEAIAKGANSIDARPRETIDAGVTVLSPRPSLGSEKGRGANTSFKAEAPGNFPARRVPATGASNPATRNAIGVPVAQHADTLNGGSPANSSGSSGGGFIRRQNLRPLVTASIPSRGKIDGARLIRPPLAPSGLGGPAKAVAGINGTTFRLKR